MRIRTGLILLFLVGCIASAHRPGSVNAAAASPTERPFCNPAWTWPSGSVMVPGTLYTATCSNVDVALIDVYQGTTYLFQITTADHSASCGDQDYALPPGTPAGSYELRPLVYPCDNCPEERKASKTVTVE